MNNGEVKPIKVDEVSAEDFENYRTRLTKKLLEHGYHAEVIVENTTLKQSIENYVIENVIQQKTKDAIQGISKKLANMDVTISNVAQVMFPIVNVYKYHNLVSSIIFYLDKNGVFCTEEVPLYEKKIIV